MEKQIIQTYKEHQKWVKMSRNFCIDDITLLETYLTTRNHWSMCKIIGKNSGDKMFVRNVELLLQNSDNKYNNRILERPLARIVLLLEAEYVNFPTKQALNYGQRVKLFVGRQL